MDVHNVILECDWLTLGCQRLIKQLAFYDTKSNGSFQYVFRFPKNLRPYAVRFDKQALESHHIAWNKNGFFHLRDVMEAIQTLPFLFRTGPVVFSAKGLEKANVLSSYGLAVRNLEDIGCPRFDQLSALEPTTTNKAKVFANWFADEEDLDESDDEEDVLNLPAEW